MVCKPTCSLFLSKLHHVSIRTKYGKPCNCPPPQIRMFVKFVFVLMVLSVEYWWGKNSDFPTLLSTFHSEILVSLSGLGLLCLPHLFMSHLIYFKWEVRGYVGIINTSTFFFPFGPGKEAKHYILSRLFRTMLGTRLAGFPLKLENTSCVRNGDQKAWGNGLTVFLKHCWGK